MKWSGSTGDVSAEDDFSDHARNDSISVVDGGCSSPIALSCDRLELSIRISYIKKRKKNYWNYNEICQYQEISLHILSLSKLPFPRLFP